MKRVLLAESADVMPFALESLRVKYNQFPMFGNNRGGKVIHLIPCMTLDSAMDAAHSNIDLVLCGLHFDESRMFDLLRFMKATPALRHIPFLCIKTTEGVLAPAIYESVKIAIHASGAEGFFDLCELIKKLGSEEALKRIGLYFDELLSPSNRLG